MPEHRFQPGNTVQGGAVQHMLAELRRKMPGIFAEGNPHGLASTGTKTRHIAATRGVFSAP